MKTTKFFLMAALALTLAACSSDDRSALPLDPVKNDILNPAQTAKGEGITITATLAPKDAGATTRAVSEGTDEIVVEWAVDEHIAILYDKDGAQMADATIKSVDSETKAATIEFSVETGTADNTACTLVYPYSAAKADKSGVKDYADLLATQDGTLSANLDVRVGAGTIKTSTPSLDVTTQPAAQFAIFKFTVKNSDASATINVKPLVVTIATQDYVITPASATSTLYAALPAVSSQTVSFSASGSDNMAYTCSKDGVTFAAAKYYQSTLKMAEISGALGGLFSVSASKKAFFSKGNLKYNGSAWSFFDNQYDYLATHDGTNWDKFGWSTSTTTYGMSTSTSNGDYSGDFKDWGTLAITNGGNAANSGWRTLTSDEWKYLFNTRASGSSVFGTENGRYAQATINTDGTGVNGVILFPDGVTITADKVSTAGTVNGTSEWATKCTSAQWTSLESAGCVFLPAAGYREGSSVGGAGSTSCYWSGTASGLGVAYRVYFNPGNLNPAGSIDRHDGYSVRLVRPAE